MIKLTSILKQVLKEEDDEWDLEAGSEWNRLDAPQYISKWQSYVTPKIDNELNKLLIEKWKIYISWISSKRPNLLKILNNKDGALKTWEQGVKENLSNNLLMDWMQYFSDNYENLYMRIESLIDDEIT